jgi:hypothetical protein
MGLRLPPMQSHEPSPEPFAQWLQRRSLELGHEEGLGRSLTQAEIADRVHYSPQYISQLWGGKTPSKSAEKNIRLALLTLP